MPQVTLLSPGAQLKLSPLWLLSGQALPGLSHGSDTASLCLFNKYLLSTYHSGKQGYYFSSTLKNQRLGVGGVGARTGVTEVAELGF